MDRERERERERERDRERKRERERERERHTVKEDELKRKQINSYKQRERVIYVLRGRHKGNKNV